MLGLLGLGRFEVVDEDEDDGDVDAMSSRER